MSQPLAATTRVMQLLVALTCAGCEESESRSSGPESKDESEANGALDRKKASGGTGSEKARRLYLQPEDERAVDLSRELNAAEGIDFGGPSSATPPPSLARGACPADMVFVAGTYCVDRFEVHMVDAALGRPLSPHYPPNFERTQTLFERWSKQAGRSGRLLEGSLSLPSPPAFSLSQPFEPSARSARGTVPAGYLSRHHSELACTHAGKRLCTRSEWIRACRGERHTRFPYGNEYRPGLCNVHRDHHPARLLHGSSSRHHLDPRLGLVEDDAGPLLHRSGDFPECASRWGGDAIYDMVGNLDEWIADPGGAFLGGFYSRATKEGCDASIDSHDPGYLDYSLGTRCCADPL